MNYMYSRAVPIANGWPTQNKLYDFGVGGVSFSFGIFVCFIFCLFNFSFLQFCGRGSKVVWVGCWWRSGRKWEKVKLWSKYIVWKKFLRKQKVGRCLFQTRIYNAVPAGHSCSSSNMYRKSQHTQQCRSHNGHSATRTATQQPSTRQPSKVTVMMNSILRIVYIQGLQQHWTISVFQAKNPNLEKSHLLFVHRSKNKIIRMLTKCRRCTLSPYWRGCSPLSRHMRGRVLTLQVQIAPLSPAAGVFHTKPQHSPAPCRVHPKSHLGRGRAGWPEACWCR